MRSQWHLPPRATAIDLRSTPAAFAWCNRYLLVAVRKAMSQELDHLKPVRAGSCDRDL